MLLKDVAQGNNFLATCPPSLRLGVAGGGLAEKFSAVFWRLAIPNQSRAWYGTSLSPHFSDCPVLKIFIVLNTKFLALTYFRPEGLSSALAGLIALFGMGRDVSPPSKHQELCTQKHKTKPKWFPNFLTGIETLVLLGSIPYGTST